MNSGSASMSWRGVALALLALMIPFTPPAMGQPTTVVPALTFPGPYPVACSNVAQDFARLRPGEDVQAYWEGVARDDGSPRYITDLLSDPGNTLIASVTAPSDSNVYGSFAGKTLPYAIIVCYPTSPANTRPDYPLANGKSVPHMQRGSEAPVFPDAATRYPVLVFSHGYLGSPTSNDYIDAIALIASFGYVVASPFHGDGRFGNLQLDSLADLPYLILHLRDFLAMQALRPLSLSATLDVLFAAPQWRDHLDPIQVGGFGASFGGESLLLMAGGGLTTSLGLAWTTMPTDRRLKAAVGYVPYFGYPFFPAFGRDQHGLDNVALPYLAIGGTLDTTAPIEETAVGMLRLKGPRELVALSGLRHGFDLTAAPDIFTWILTFLDAEVRGDTAARAKLSRMASVAGGADDFVVIPLQPPGAVNYGGLWWNAPAGSEAGWGMNLAHQDDVIYMTWFTYDANGNGWWLAMSADRMPDGTYRGTIYSTRGPPFFATPFDPAAVVATPVGTGTLSFVDADNGTFAYTVNGIMQAKTITREIFGPLPTCTFGSSIDPAQSTFYQDLWWAAPPGAEAGWGVNLAQQGSIIVVTWFTYDDTGAPMWLVATATATSATQFTGVLYRTTGPPYNAVPFNRANVVATPVGTVTLTFQTGNLATFGYTVNGISQSKTITREVLRAPGTLCQ
jgi:predicted dienelactone hydrolase